MKLSTEEKQIKRLEYNEMRSHDEKDLMGGFELIYPLPDTLENHDKNVAYQRFLASAV